MHTENTLINARTGKAIDLAMQKLEVTGRVYPLGSFVRVTHRFKCLGTQPMEAIYVSALPTGGVLRRFKVIGENFEVDSKLEPRKKARKEYEQGVADGHLSVLAETNQDGLVHLSVGQVQPDEEVSVVMDVVVGVSTKDKGFQFRFPFTLAPSYHAQAKVSATEGGGKIELPEDVFGDLTLPEWKTSRFGLHEVSFSLLVFGGSNLATISSPSHRISVAPQTDGSVQVSLAGMGDTPNRDLVLDVRVPEAQPTLFADATLLGVPATGKEPAVPAGAARWTALIPSSCFSKGGAPQSRKVCFVLDRSGSMAGQPLERGKQALLACLSALQPDDEFGLVHFGSDAVTFHGNLVKADDANRNKARAWVERIGCDGGTEMLGALAAATRVLDGVGDVFLLTDGDVFQTGPIVEHMAASQSRVHVLGIGTASQHRFMAQLARRTGGVSDMVSPMEDVGLAGLKLFNQIQEPVLQDPTVLHDGVALPNVGTVWSGLPLLVNDPKGNGSLLGTLMVAGQPFSQFVQVPVPDGLTALLWAGRRIEDLSSKMDMVAVGTPKADRIEKEMTDLSVGYGLASRVMSLVAVVERIGDQAGVQPEQKIVSVGLPEGMEDLFEQKTSGGILRGMPRMRAPGFLGGQNPTNGGYHSQVMSFSAASTSSSRGLSSSANFLCMAEPEHAMSSSVAPASLMDFHEGGDLANALGAGFAAACAAALPVKPDDWSYTGNLLVDLGGLLADGGVPGSSLEERVMQTALLALIVALAAQQTPGVYDKHLDRMRAFLEANKALVDPLALAKVLRVLRGKEPSKMDQKVLESYFSQEPLFTAQGLRMGL